MTFPLLSNPSTAFHISAQYDYQGYRANNSLKTANADQPQSPDKTKARLYSQNSKIKNIFKKICVLHKQFYPCPLAIAIACCRVTSAILIDILLLRIAETAWRSQANGLENPICVVNAWLTARPEQAIPGEFGDLLAEAQLASLARKVKQCLDWYYRLTASDVALTA